MSFELSDYNDVASRMREFFEKYPDGRLRPASPWRVETIGERAFIVYEAAALREADDKNPGIGTAWEPFPGRTPYTRDSELMNAETSAWGRAILAVGAADTRKGIASAEEVRNRRAERENWDDAAPAQPPEPGQVRVYDELSTQLRNATTVEQIRTDWWKSLRIAHTGKQITQSQFDRLSRKAAARTAELEQAAS